MPHVYLQMNSIRDLVFSALSNHPDLREAANSDRLVRYVQVSQKNNGSTKQAKYDSITRIARILRREHLALRGKDWEENNKHRANKVREQILNNSFGG